MPYGEAIQQFPAKPPVGNEEVHQSDEAAVVGGFPQVRHFMYDDVFETFAWFLRQIGIEPDACGRGATTSPFRLHLLHKEPLHFHADERLPFRD